MECIRVVTATPSSATNAPLVFMNICSPRDLRILNVHIWTQHTNLQSLEVGNKITVAHPIKSQVKMHILPQALKICLSGDSFKTTILGNVDLEHNHM